MSTYWGYARISTASQSQNSIEEQLDYLKDQAKKLNCGFEQIAETHSAKNVAGRTKLANLVQNLAKDGDVIGFKYADRYGRETEEDLALLRLLSEKNIKVHINSAFVDYRDPTSKFTFTTLSAVGTFQRELQNQKSRQGIKKKKEKGDWIFTGKLFGYKVVRNSKKTIIEIIESEAKILRFIFEEYAKGDSINHITKLVNEKFNRSLIPAIVRRWILKPLYKGYYLIEGAGQRKGQERIRHYDETALVKSNYYAPIISEELWDEANRSYRGVHRVYARQFEYRYSHYELAGILKCYYCLKETGKATTYVHTWDKNSNSKVYNNYADRTHAKGCGQDIFTFRSSILESIFRTSYYLLFANPIELSHYFKEKEEEFNKKTGDVQGDIDRLEKLLKGVDRKLDKITDYLLEEDADAISLLKKSKIQKDKREQLIESIDKEREIINFQKLDLESAFEEFNENRLLKFIHANPSKKRKIYIQTLESAFVHGRQIKIKFKNKKEYIIPLSLNRGRRIQRQFEIQVHFDGKHQYDVSLDTEKNDLKYIRKAIDRGLEQREKLFKVAAEQMNEDMINGLKMKIENFVSVESV